MSVLYNFDVYLLLTFYHQLIKLSKKQKNGLIGLLVFCFRCKVLSLTVSALCAWC